MKKSIIIIALLVAVIIGETVYFSLKLKGKNKEVGKAQQELASPEFDKGLENIYVQVRIKQETKDGLFTDSLYFTADEWKNMSAESVKQQIKDRVTKWATVTATPEGQ